VSGHRPGLCLDAPEAVGSYHPGTPPGIAAAAYVPRQRFVHVDPADPVRANRDRLMLSGGWPWPASARTLFATPFGRGCLPPGDSRGVERVGSSRRRSGPHVGPASLLAADEMGDPRGDNDGPGEKIVARDARCNHRIVAGEEPDPSCPQRRELVQELGARSQGGDGGTVEDDLDDGKIFADIVEEVCHVAQCQSLAVAASLVDVDHDSDSTVGGW